MKCLYCGNEIKISFRTKGRKFCSTSCNYKYHHNKAIDNTPIFCVACGKKLSGRRRKYCSNECKNKYNNEMYKNLHAEVVQEEPKKRGIPKKKLSLSEVSALARQEGLTYGKYCEKHNLY